MTTPSDLIEALERLRSLLIVRATGGAVDEQEFVLLRRIAVNEERLDARLPPFLKSCRCASDFWSFIKAKADSYEGRREFLRDSFEPLLASLESESRAPVDLLASPVLDKVDSEHVQDAWRKSLARRESDPSGSITAARSLIESVCKHILDKAGVSYDDRLELPKLYSLTTQQLNLAPSQHTDQIFKQILGGCQAVVEGLAALRNRLSDAHGKGQHGLKPAPRHAELAVNLAGSMATYLIGTWEARSANDRTP